MKLCTEDFFFFLDTACFHFLTQFFVFHQLVIPFLWAHKQSSGSIEFKGSYLGFSPVVLQFKQLNALKIRAAVFDFFLPTLFISKMLQKIAWEHQSLNVFFVWVMECCLHCSPCQCTNRQDYGQHRTVVNRDPMDPVCL